MTKKILLSLLAITVLCSLAALPAMADDWVYLGNAHVDGNSDHDNIKVGDSAGQYRFLQIRVVNAPIAFDHIVVHYGNGEPETLHVRDVIRPGGKSRAIKLDGTRYVSSFELWYAKANPDNTNKPELTLWGKK